MPAKVKSVPPEVGLVRVLEGLEPLLVEATDEEVTQAAQDLGMDLSMKGSAAFIGLKWPMVRHLSDIFDLSSFTREQLEAWRLAHEERVESARRELRAKGAYLPSDRKDSDEK